MKAIYNGQLINNEVSLLSSNNRGFRYGDGLFETLAIIDGKARLLEKHLERLSDGMQVLQLDKTSFSMNEIIRFIENLCVENKVDKRGKSRIYVWRESDGLYSPASNGTSFLITLEDDQNGKDISFSKQAGISKNTRNSFSMTSSYKTMSALKYVIAGIERTERILDDIIIKDIHGNISETLSSNIFIKLGKKYYTPPVSTGCINGIMRNWLISEMQKSGDPVLEETFSEGEMLQAESIFTSNSSGISHIMRIEEVEFSIDQQINTKMKKLDMV